MAVGTEGAVDLGDGNRRRCKSPGRVCNDSLDQRGRRFVQPREVGEFIDGGDEETGQMTIDLLVHGNDG